MRVLIVNTAEKTGGAAIAAGRLMEALNKHGVKAKMLVRDKQTDSIMVVKAPCSPLHKVWERARIFVQNGVSQDNLWQVDLANTGVDITHLDEFREADVIHLHWVNQGFLSMGSLRRIVESGKRIVWTLHDEWPYLGVCHYRGDCDQPTCGCCPLLKGSVARKLREHKLKLIRQGNIRFVGCSQWITDQALKAMPDVDVRHINNAIDTKTYQPMDRELLRRKLQLPADKKLILFVSQKVTDERKGVRYLMQALDLLQKAGHTDFKAVVVGHKVDELTHPMLIPIGTKAPHEMPEIYAAVDAFVTPSLQDNLPNTIVEAMACGTPCVGFRIGGIPEMIDHLHTGYVAHYKDADDLARGIDYVLSHPDLGQAARHAAVQAYNESRIAKLHIELYEKPRVKS